SSVQRRDSRAVTVAQCVTKAQRVTNRKKSLTSSWTGNPWPPSRRGCSLRLKRTTVCLACLTTISAAVLLQPLASITHGSSRWVPDLEGAFATRKIPPLRFSHLGGDLGSALELVPLRGDPSTDAGYLAEAESDSD
ncbi:hypothetical protein MTO96_040695, partial [Rhipicephalus appendiculatus]